MKTSNKLIIAFLVFGLCIIMYVVINVRLHYEGYRKSGELPQFEYLNDLSVFNIEVDKFNEIAINCRSHVYYKQGETQSLMIKASNKTARRLDYDVKGQVLVFGNLDLKPKKDFVEIHITSPDIKTVSIGEGVRFDCKGLRTKRLEVNSDGGNIVGALYVHELNINATNKAHVNIEGECDTLYLKALQGSVCHASELHTGFSDVLADDNSVVNVNVQGELTQQANNGSVISNMNISVKEFKND